MHYKNLQLKYIFSSIILLIVFTGCGGGGGGGSTPSDNTTSKVGYFIDSAVAGVDYNCGSTSGKTDLEGKFNYKSSDTSCTFKIGTLTLGSINTADMNSDEKLTIQDLVDVNRTNISDTNVIKIATLLQSLDSDGDSSNGINILVTISDVNKTIDQLTNSELNTTITDLNKTVKTQDDVLSHLRTSMIDLGAISTTPNQFSFVNSYSVAINQVKESNSITVSGIDTYVTISVSNGEYKKNEEDWTDQNGTINSGDAVKVRHTSSSSFETSVTTTLSIGDKNASYTSTTGIEDTVPEAFTFSTKANVEPDSVISSDEINITGTTVSTTITVDIGEYSINDGNWTDQAGTIEPTDNVKVRHTSSSSYSTDKNTTLTIGGVTGYFVSTTRAIDLVPNEFTFTNKSDQNLSTEVESNSVTIAGIDQDLTISITNGEYKINTGSWTSGDGTVSNNDTITLKQTTSSSYDTQKTTTFIINDVNKTFTTQTRIADIIPDDFSFTSKNDVTIDTNVSSETIYLSGVDNNIDINISILNGWYKIEDGDWTNSVGTVQNGDAIVVQHTTTSEFDTNTTTTLFIGDKNATFTTTTESIDTTPDSFTLASKTDVEKNAYVESDEITVVGINYPTTISIVNGQYSIDGADWTSEDSNVSVNQVVKIRHKTPRLKAADTNSTLTIGGVSAIFTTTTNLTSFTAYLSDGLGINGVSAVSDENGTTLSDGSFQYDGSKVTFKLNNLVLGSIDAENVNLDEKITLQEIVGLPRTTITSTELSKLVVLLHSLDDDGNGSNGIDLRSNNIDSNLILDGNLTDFSLEQIETEIKRLGKYPKVKFDAMHDMLTNLKDANITINDFVTYPEANATNVGPYTIVKIGFGESMNESSITGSSSTNARVKYKDSSSFKNTSKCTYSDTSKTATCLIKTSMLNEDSNYTIQLTTSIKNSADEAISSYEFSFTTAQENNLPKLRTGQSTSYDENDDTTTVTVKDDAYYSASDGIERIFTRATTVVVDTKTGLMWNDDTDANSTDGNLSVATTYCNDKSDDGYTEWRLPTIKEFNLISDKGDSVSPFIFSSFNHLAIDNTGNAHDAYWTSNVDPDDNKFSYMYTFYSGFNGSEENNTTFYTRCVHGDTNSSQFVRDAVNGIVIDTTSGLMWQDNIAATSQVWFSSEAAESSNDDAIKTCENLSLGGYTDWKLPNFNELLSLVEMDEFDVSQSAYTPTAFQYLTADNYWTSTTYAQSPTNAWTINFSTTGSISGALPKSNTAKIICVRDY